MSTIRLGRLVSNHSTIVPGLGRLLSQLSLVGGVRTVVPGRIARAGSKPGGGLRLAVTVPTGQGFKLIARRGTMTQEVFVVTQLDRSTIERAVADSIALANR